MAAAVERMRLIPRLLEQGEANVRSAPLPWTERALRECTGARNFLSRGIDLLAASHGDKQQALRRAADVAMLAFTRYETYLRETLRFAESDRVASGGEPFDMLMREGHQLEMDGDAIAAYASEQLAETKQKLAQQAEEFGVKEWQDALGKLSAIHPTLSKYAGAIRRCGTRVESFPTRSNF